MNFFSAIKKTFFSKNIVNFSSRACRSEYWWSFLVAIPLQIIFQLGVEVEKELLQNSAVNKVLGYESNVPTSYSVIIWIVLIVGLYFSVGMLAVSCRRLHDLNYSGAWIILGFIPLVNIVIGIAFLIMFCRKGTSGENKYGADPLSN